MSIIALWYLLSFELHLGAVWISLGFVLGGIGRCNYFMA